MEDIKTKEPIQDVKAFDRIGDLKDHVRSTMVKSREAISGFDENDPESAEVYAEEQVEQGVQDTAETLKYETMQSIERGREAYRERRADKAESDRYASQTVKTRETPEKDVKTRDKASEKERIKTADKSAKGPKRSVKTAESTGRKAVKTTEKGAKEASDAPKKVKKTAERIRRIRQAITRAAKAVAAAVKAAAVAVKSIIAFLLAGGWVIVVFIAVAGVICAVVMSVFGIFFGGEENRPLHEVVSEITLEFQEEIDLKRVEIDHDKEEVRGARAPWKEVLAVFAVKTAGDPTNATDVITMTKDKETRLRSIFWRMNEITTKVENRPAEGTAEVTDQDDNELKEEETEEKWLVIEVKHKTAWDMAEHYRFSDEQKENLAMLLDESYDKYWMDVLYRYHTRNFKMVGTALAEVGNIGGEKYWKWYGFGFHVEWCACFVSWVANENGYIDEGFCPKFSQCAYGVRWFMEHDRWIDGSMVPEPGMLIFFDWDTPEGKYGPQDAHSDHVGIVEKVEDGIVYTIEGNCQDMCKQKQYPVGWYEIMGYGGVR